MARGFDLEHQLARAAAAEGSHQGNGRRVQLGRFQLIRMLGRGAMGTVFEARDVTSGKHVAVKVLNELDGREIYRIKREFRSLAGVSHPNLIALSELFSEDDHWFFTMELVDGVPFDQWVRPHACAPHFDESRLRTALGELACAIHAVHSAGKVHGDLKPSNVLVTKDGTVKVLDFGLVTDKALGAEPSAPPLGRAPELLQRDLLGREDTEGDGGACPESQTQTRPTSASQTVRLEPYARFGAGTPAYMAPETAKGDAPSEASDWYAFGAMLFQALTGRLPFEGPPRKLLADKQRLDAPPVEALCAAAPRDLCELCARLLRRDPRARPDATFVLEAVGALSRAQARALAVAALPSPTLIGRSAELAVLRGALGDASQGRPQLVLVGGPSGIGKSALLEHFGAESPGVILTGRCYQQESVPYKAFDAVIDSLSRYLRTLPERVVEQLTPRNLAALTQLFPVLSTVRAMRASADECVDPREQRKRAFSALKELLSNLTARTSVSIVVDDLQWGDTDSILMLRHLLAEPDPPPLLIVGAYRSDEVRENAFLRHLLDESTFGPHVRRHLLSLGPLPSDAGVALVRELSASSDVASGASAIVEEAGGIPFFIVELVRLLEERHTAGEGDPARAPASLDALVLERVSALPQDGQHLLNVMSVAARPIEYAVAEQAAELGADSLRTLLALRAARLIRVRQVGSSSMVEIYHDRVRHALVSQLSPATLSELHGRLAQAMLDQGVDDSERVVAHLVGAGERQQAGEAAVAAAHQAMQKLAFNRAAELFEHAVHLLSPEQAAREDLHWHRAQALANAGRGAPAAEAFLEAATYAHPERAAELRRLAAQQYLRSGRMHEGLRLAQEVLASVGVHLPSSPTRMLLAFLWERGRLKTKRLRGLTTHRAGRAQGVLPRLKALRDLSPELTTHHVLTGALLQARYLNDAIDTGDPEYTLQALAWEVYNASVTGGPRQEKWAAHVQRAVLVLAEQMQTPYAHALTHFTEAARLLFSGRRYREAIAPALEAKRTFAEHCTGAFWERSVMDFFHLLCLEFTGSLSEQVERSAEALRDAKERDDRFLALLMLLCVPYSHLIRDEPELAVEFLERERSSLDPNYSTHRYLWLLRMLDTYIYMGEARRAVALLDAEWGALVRSHIYRSRYIQHGANYFRARCVLAGYAETAEPRLISVAQEALAILRRDTGAFGGCGQALSAGLGAIGGDRAQSVRELESACARLTAAQASVIALYAERRLHEQRGDERSALRVDEELRRQGVVNPARWLWTHMPIGAGR